MRDVVCPLLIDRDGEMAEGVAALDHAARGEGGVLFLLGEAGIGKTRLARELLARAGERGFAVLSGRALHRGSPVPYRPFAEALRSGAGVGAVEDRALRWLVSDIEGEDASEPVNLAVAEALVRALSQLGQARGATALLLEDLHWADPESLTVLGVPGRPPCGAPGPVRRHRAHWRSQRRGAAGATAPRAALGADDDSPRSICGGGRCHGGRLPDDGRHPTGARRGPLVRAGAGRRGAAVR